MCDICSGDKKFVAECGHIYCQICYNSAIKYDNCMICIKSESLYIGKMKNIKSGQSIDLINIEKAINLYNTMNKEKFLQTQEYKKLNISEIKALSFALRSKGNFKYF